MSPDCFLYKPRKGMSVILICLVCAWLLLSVASFVIPFKEENVINVFNNTVRLRVVANSDSKSDTELKLKVRDDIIGVASEIFKDCESVEEAKERILKNTDILLKTAEESVRNHGSELDVSVTFGKESCPVRRYSEFTFPAGEYLTLRINLGKAEGENWWCVMYPPLCVSAATGNVCADAETFIAYGFPKKLVDELLNASKQPAKIRFKLSDLFHR